MITNLELDDALAAQLDVVAKAQGISTREFIRAALRQAIASTSPGVKPTRFVQRVHDFGTHIETPWTLLVDIEGDDYLQKHTRK